jgi:hypothetical protein
VERALGIVALVVFVSLPQGLPAFSRFQFTICSKFGIETVHGSTVAPASKRGGMTSGLSGLSGGCLSSAFCHVTSDCNSPGAVMLGLRERLHNDGARLLVFSAFLHCHFQLAISPRLLIESAIMFSKFITIVVVMAALAHATTFDAIWRARPTTPPSTHNVIN